MPQPLVFAVIEDDSGVRHLLSSIIRRAGHIPVEAATVQEGELVLCEYPWDIAVVDRGLPDGDGLALCRTDERRKDVSKSRGRNCVELDTAVAAGCSGESRNDALAH